MTPTGRSARRPTRIPDPPSFALPPDATDCHAHVFGPESRYPDQENRAYTPRDLPLPQLREMHAALGLRRLVVVQASAHGLDNGAVLDAVATDRANLRGIGAVSQDATDEDLQRLNDGGIRGIRVNLVDKGEHALRLARRALEHGGADPRFRLAHRASRPCRAPDEELRQLADTVCVPMSVGHVGYTKAASGGEAHPGFAGVPRASARRALLGEADRTLPHQRA